jgi:hypothetical protein
VCTLFTLALEGGDAGAMHRASEALAAAKPLWHPGDEFLARSFARRGDGTAALDHSDRALRIAPYCHNAWIARGEALVVAGQLAQAREAAARSQALVTASPGDDLTVLAAALAGDAGALERALAARYPVPTLPFPVFVEKLRDAASSGR